VADAISGSKSAPASAAAASAIVCMRAVNRARAA
jgi:hypothetical protein